MDKLEELNKQLILKRESLRLTEEWEFLPDDKTLKSKSPKAIAYRRSKVYAFLKKSRQEFDGNKCIKCGSTKNLQFHHLTYRRYFYELLEDGITLCRGCHEKGHGHNPENLVLTTIEKTNNLDPLPVSTTSKRNQTMSIKSTLECAQNCEIHLEEIVAWIMSYNEHEQSGTGYAERVDQKISQQFNVNIQQIRSDCGLLVRRRQVGSSTRFCGPQNFAKCKTEGDVRAALVKKISDEKAKARQNYGAAKTATVVTTARKTVEEAGDARLSLKMRQDLMDTILAGVANSNMPKATASEIIKKIILVD